MIEILVQTGSFDNLLDYSCRHTERAGLAFPMESLSLAGSGAVHITAGYSSHANPQQCLSGGTAAY
jgi:hypothetical protein